MGYRWHDFNGAAVIILSYLALQPECVDSRRILYSTLNGVGALLVILSLMFEFSPSAFIIEALWILISVLGIIRRLKVNKAL
ncbi:MAG: hypothetical protein GY732_07895 [Gammaproteobacteria bacterium]|nr:hypothetical protein [Gammaproteobacteria bacterium]